jgi:hypothetical protein
MSAAGRRSVGKSKRLNRRRFERRHEFRGEKRLSGCCRRRDVGERSHQRGHDDGGGVRRTTARARRRRFPCDRMHRARLAVFMCARAFVGGRRERCCDAQAERSRGQECRLGQKPPANEPRAMPTFRSHKHDQRSTNGARDRPGGRSTLVRFRRRIQVRSCRLCEHLSGSPRLRLR